MPNISPLSLGTSAKEVKDVVSLPSAALSAITVPASPATITNSDKVIAQYAVSGGTVSAIALIRNSVETALGLTSGVFTLSRNDALKITYTVAPTVVKIPA